MTIELVDGHGGKPHISGDDLGDFKAGILGDAGYVFKRADMLAATLNGANSLTVNTGSGVLPVSGRHFRITAPETVTVTSGTQGQNRNDLVVIRPSTSNDGTTVENVSVVVLRGTPTDGDAVDPEKEDTDLALYRLQLTGISVAEPIALFDVMVPYNEFRDSISQFEAKVLWSNPAGQYMQASQTINLNEKISEQRTGIVLHWQGYEENEAKNYDHNYCFIPKTHTSRSGVAMFLTNQSGTHVGTKYVYVSNTKIEGHDNNYSNATASGITLDRRYFVLTEVLGV